MSFETGAETDMGRRPAKSLAAYRTTSLIVIAIAFSIVFYMGIGYFLTGSSVPEGDSVMLRNQMYAVALFLALGSIVLRRIRLSPARLEVAAATGGPDGVARHILNLTMICAAIGEAVGIIGLVLTVMMGDPGHVLRLGAVGLLLVLINYPRRRAWERTIGHFASRGHGTTV